MNGHFAKYLIFYDIADSRRLRCVHRTIRDWGMPIQLSVFEAELNPAQLERLIEQLTELIEASEDKVMFYRLSPSQKPISLGLSSPTEDLLFV
jgi:CRISPR-associated protein Cas2